MNRSSHTVATYAPARLGQHAAAFGLAAVMTLGLLGGVSGLADREAAAAAQGVELAEACRPGMVLAGQGPALAVSAVQMAQAHGAPARRG
ncbi:MAG: hypothetical protein KBC73_00860 [Burkholderiaceae bacterium]|nr:hypothetical protein [Burkholderiaceae bacterium]